MTVRARTRLAVPAFHDGCVPWTDEVIETQRLRLRAFREADKALIFELMTDPEVRRHLGGPVTDEEELAGLRGAVVGERPDVWCVADAATDTALGRVSFDDHRGEWEVGYELARSAWGRGLATEAVGAAIAWFWSGDRGASVIAVTQTANERSRRLLDALGFTLERELEEFGAMQSQYRVTAPV